MSRARVVHTVAIFFLLMCVEGRAQPSHDEGNIFGSRREDDRPREWIPVDHQWLIPILCREKGNPGKQIKLKLGLLLDRSGPPRAGIFPESPAQHWTTDARGIGGYEDPSGWNSTKKLRLVQEDSPFEGQPIEAWLPLSPRWNEALVSIRVTPEKGADRFFECVLDRTEKLDRPRDPIQREMWLDAATAVDIENSYRPHLQNLMEMRCLQCHQNSQKFESVGILSRVDKDSDPSLLQVRLQALENAGAVWRRSPNSCLDAASPGEAEFLRSRKRLVVSLLDRVREDLQSSALQTLRDREPKLKAGQSSSPQGIPEGIDPFLDLDELADNFGYNEIPEPILTKEQTERAYEAIGKQAGVSGKSVRDIFSKYPGVRHAFHIQEPNDKYTYGETHLSKFFHSRFDLIKALVGLEPKQTPLPNPSLDQHFSFKPLSANRKNPSAIMERPVSQDYVDRKAKTSPTAKSADRLSGEMVQTLLSWAHDSPLGYRYRLPTRAEWEAAKAQGVIRPDGTEWTQEMLLKINTADPEENTKQRSAKLRFVRELDRDLFAEDPCVHP